MKQTPKFSGMCAFNTKTQNFLADIHTFALSGPLQFFGATFCLGMAIPAVGLIFTWFTVGALLIFSQIASWLPDSFGINLILNNGAKLILAMYALLLATLKVSCLMIVLVTAWLLVGSIYIRLRFRAFKSKLDFKERPKNSLDKLFVWFDRSEAAILINNYRESGWNAIVDRFYLLLEKTGFNPDAHVILDDASRVSKSELKYSDKVKGSVKLAITEKGLGEFTVTVKLKPHKQHVLDLGHGDLHDELFFKQIVQAIKKNTMI